ncbi:MAG: HAD family hydrolase [Lachnospiraceae bacterium]
MINSKKAIIFDLDGSLVDSMWIWKQVDHDYLARFGYELPPTLQAEIGGKSFSETAEFVKEKFNIPHTVEEIKEDWNKMAFELYTTKVFLKEGVKEIMEYAKNRQMKLGIATSNSRFLVDCLLEALNITSYFHCVKTSCDVKRGKPFPDVYLAVSNELEIDPKDCLVFEDIVNGIVAAKTAGMTVCGVEDIYSHDSKEEKMKVSDFYIHSYLDICFNN